jgi:hypothetical protein
LTEVPAFTEEWWLLDGFTDDFTEEGSADNLCEDGFTLECADDLADAGLTVEGPDDLADGLAEDFALECLAELGSTVE